MKGNKQAKGSFFTLLLRNYILFTLLIVVSLSGVFIITVLRVSGKIVEIDPKQLLEFQDVLAQGEYAELPAERLFGQNSILKVLNEKNQIVYTSGIDTIDVAVSTRELFYIPDYIKTKQINVTKFDNAIGEPQISVVITQQDEQNSDSSKKMYLLDQNYNILYNSELNPRVKLTKKEFDFLTGTYQNSIKISKHTFLTNKNQRYTLLIFQPENTITLMFGNIAHVIADSFVLFLILYFIIIAIFIFWLNRKVKKPLSILRDAIGNVSNGNHGQYLNYKGPIEFVNIFDSFNDMSNKLMKSEQERKKLEAGRQKMLADISHDFKTPISVIQGYAKALSDGLVTAEKKPIYLQIIASRAEMLNELINTFHEYSKLEHPDYVLTLEPCDICVFLRDYLAEKYSELELLGFHLDLEIPESHILCDLDKLQFKRAIENIVSNSVKHNENGTTLFFRLSFLEDEIKITIADNGAGVSKEIGQTIFEPFVVGEKSRSNQGSGLGLAISKKIVEAHGGMIAFIQPPEKGYHTQFEIILPRHERPKEP